MSQKLVKTTQNDEQNNPLGVARMGGLETKVEETAGQMTVGHIKSYKFVRFGLKGLNWTFSINRVSDELLTVIRVLLFDFPRTGTDFEIRWGSYYTKYIETLILNSLALSDTIEFSYHKLRIFC